MSVRPPPKLALLLPLAVAVVGVPSLPAAEDDAARCSAPMSPPKQSTSAPAEQAESDAATKVGWVRWDHYQTHCFSMHLRTRQMLDFTVFSQNGASVAQLGTIDSKFQWREAQFLADGQVLCFEEPWSYAVELDFGGFDLPQGQRFGFSKFWLEIPVVSWASVRFGRQTTPFSLEILEAGGDISFMERSLAAFDIGTQTGLIVGKNTLDGRLTWVVGLFSNWIAGGSQWGVTTRATGLPMYEHGGEHLLHVEVSGRYLTFPGGSEQVEGRPATHVGPYFVDTGAFPAIGAWGFDAALLAISGPLSLQAEILETKNLSSQAGNPNLWGWYVTASWFLTGETRPYDKQRAIPVYPVPLGKWGAAELAVRYFLTDLTSGNIRGGVLRDLQAGASWYIGAMFRVDFNYGYVWLNRSGITGISGVYGFRLQFQI